ncbi:class I SAM-dependent methyltransferase [Corynebacterium maris]|uniref:class I SAM-dependent methyltransferase n=1 Tax=Corynebacterium maris TaxID=575200 RepID=UPI000421D2D7|nr:class I SAM-dependent methyltransferase [Corynebacterium maris]
MSRDHLLAIDADQWPGVAQPPSARLRARVAEAYFARTVDKAGLDLLDDPDLVIDHEELFDRVAVSGWLGLAESYMAGEWHTRDSDALVDVLQALISAGYRPRVRQVPVGRKEGELPSELIRQFSGDGMSAFGAVYASGVPTTVRESVPSYVPGAGRGSEPAKHFVDVTTVAEPTSVERADLGDGQRRAVEKLLDAAQVTRGTHVLEYPSSGGEVAIAAAQRRAAVDVLTGDPKLASALEERMLLAGVDEAVHTELVDDPRAWRGRYDAIIGVETLETLGGRQRDAYVRGLDRLLAIGGRAALQTVVATEEMTAAGAAAPQALRAYVWPGLNFATVAELHKLFDRRTGLRITAQVHSNTHYLETLRAQRSLFEGHLREAAAEGFDQVFRRLWVFQFAVREALFNLGMLDAVQLTLRHRNRGGHR